MENTTQLLMIKIKNPKPYKSKEISSKLGVLSDPFYMLRYCIRVDQTLLSSARFVEHISNIYVIK